MSQSLLIQGRFQQVLNFMSRKDTGRSFLVAIPSDSGQVSTNRGMVRGGKSARSRNPFWFRAGFNIVHDVLIVAEGDLARVAIPSDSGQVSTKTKEEMEKEIKEIKRVAIPSDSGQVSTLGSICWARGSFEIKSQSLLIQGRFQLVDRRYHEITKSEKVAIPSDSGQVSTYTR